MGFCELTGSLLTVQNGNTHTHTHKHTHKHTHTNTHTNTQTHTHTYAYIHARAWGCLYIAEIFQRIKYTILLLGGKKVL